MSLRGRLALLTTGAVALAIVVSSVAAWVLIRASLLDQVDQRLRERRVDVETIAEDTRGLLEEGIAATRVIGLLHSDAMTVQLIGPEGRVRQLGPEGQRFVFDPGTQALLEAAGEDELVTVALGSTRYRAMSIMLGDGDSLLRVFQPLEGVETTLTRIAWLLAAVAAAGVLSAALLGRATASAGLKPVDQLVAATEAVALTRDLGHRIRLGDQNDEIARLATSVNAMLSALEAARTQQRELVENAGHELRTPLATLRNDLGLLLRSEQDPDRRLPAAERAALLADLDTEAEGLTELVNEVVNLARGEIELEPLVEDDLGDLVRRAVERSRRIDPAVAVGITAGNTHGRVRPVALERAVANLVRNAVQASHTGGTVEVVLEEREGSAVIEVSDRGPGIPDEEKPRIFDRFYRGAAARKRHGSGLGLAIVSQVTELHHGRVTVRHRPGGGSVFTLEIPLCPPGDEGPSVAAHDSADS